MIENLHEYCDARGAALRVDRPRAVIQGVKVLGLESRNGRTYLPEALAQAAGLYEGAKVNVNHPRGGPLAPREYQERIGVLRGAVARPEGLFADLHYNPKHALAEQLLWDAEHAPENVGLSHHVEARTARRGEQTVVEAILKVQSVDLVADPATTRGLFESAGGTDGSPGPQPSASAEPPSKPPVNTGPKPPASASDSAPLDPPIALSQLTLEQLRQARPDLADQLLAEQTLELRKLMADIDRLRRAELQRELRPLSREQLLAEGRGALDAREFARAIR
jgi:hypothetical protein